RTVSEVVPTTREVTYNVTTYVTEAREGSRTVYDTVEERVRRKVSVCVQEPYEDVIRVAVSHGCDYAATSGAGCGYSGGYGASCAPAASSCCGKFKLFRGR